MAVTVAIIAWAGARGVADAVGHDLVQLRVRGFPILSDWYVVYPNSRSQSPVAERFVDFVLRKGPDVLPIEKLEKQVEQALRRV